MAKHPCFYGHLLLLPDYCQTLLEFLRPVGKQKLPISFGNQEFTANCFSSKWCHQHHYFIFSLLRLKKEVIHKYLKINQCFYSCMVAK